MRIDRITWRNRNDFHWIGKCEFCEHEEHQGDGYADDFYCYRVVPNRRCVSCGLSSLGETQKETEE